VSTTFNVLDEIGDARAREKKEIKDRGLDHVKVSFGLMPEGKAKAETILLNMVLHPTLANSLLAIAASAVTRSETKDLRKDLIALASFVAAWVEEIDAAGGAND
jgi:hypothetical protein